ncbi:MAG TPA: PAS domain-containing protein [Afifellaceae bacterium]|nr:PAS domain-containing protein [Afifellaceae bacterium]
MKHPLSRRLHAYWDRRRGSGRVPERCDIVPAELGAQLVDCFLIELTAAAPARFRFCGSSLAVRYGRDLTDEDFLSLWQGADRRAWSDALGHMRRTATGIVAGVSAETMGSGFATFELVLLPLRSATECDSAIGCMVRVGGHEAANRIKTRIVAQSLDCYRCLDNRSGFLAARQPTAASAPPPRRPHLVLIEGNLSAR